LEGEIHRLFCHVFLDETLSHFCWEDDELCSNALPLEYINDIVVRVEPSTGSDDETLPVFALILSNEQALKVICPNAAEFQLWVSGMQRLLTPSVSSNHAAEFQLWVSGMQRLLTPSVSSNHDDDATDESSAMSDRARTSNQLSTHQPSSGGFDYDAAALAPYDYAEDNEEYITPIPHCFFVTSCTGTGTATPWATRSVPTPPCAATPRAIHKPFGSK
jgi:hypothetical protein